jgi:hypothetical protein
MQIKPGTHCPFINGECIQFKCTQFIQIRGVNPNTGQEVDEWNCSFAWAPMLLIENSQQQRQTAAAVESFRNEMINSNEITKQVLIASIKPDLKVIG